MKSIIALSTLMLLASASAATFTDARGDAEPALDILALSWTVADSITVNWTLADAPQTGASYTAIVYVGDANASDPEESYVVHYGPGGATVLTGHTDPVQELTPEVTLNGTQMAFSFARVEPSDSSCNFAVASTSTYDGQKQIHDSLPDEDIDPGEAWRAGRYCLMDPIRDAIKERVDGWADKIGIPGPTPLAILGLLLLAARR